MTTVSRRTTAKLGDFVVFLIGMRVFFFGSSGKWLPMATAMPRMLIELS